MVTLKNKRRQMASYNLDAPFFTKNANETPLGQPCAITFLALEKKAELNDAVLSCTEVASALARGDLIVLAQTKPAPKVESKPLEEPLKGGRKPKS
jgi:hypothetical protein